jgi:hypothetical protein
VGAFARDEGTKTPGRLIASAKSWLSHSGVDRTAELLPWQGAADVERLSPVEVSARYLRHMRAAWDARFPHAPLADQDVVITLPASFDEVARELTVEAARLAGLPRVVLIEEPQAAFYAWVDKHADDWHERVEPGQTILVCDIGGGTTDFTLIRVRKGRETASTAQEKVQFHRVAVGDHLILGGDNLDLALAHYIERKLTGDGKLPPAQWDVLLRSSRRVKEFLLSESAPDKLTVNLAGSGAKLIGGGFQIEVQRVEIEQLLTDGFLPFVRLEEKPAHRQSGFQEFGLPYAPDSAITRYLAAFLAAHRDTAHPQEPIGSPAEPVAQSVAEGRCLPPIKPIAVGGNDPARPDIVLLGGGFFASPVLRQRFLSVLASWFSTDLAPWQPLVLDNERLELAVARGAAYYGMVRRGEGVAISANLARSYYIGVEPQQDGELAAVCLIPGSAEPGQKFELTGTTFQLAVATPVEFPLFVSSTRLTDSPGDIVGLDREQMTPLPPIRTVLHTARRSNASRGTGIPVHLHSRLTEIGTMEVWCRQIDSDRTWRLQFDVRSATQTDLAGHESAAEGEGFVDEARWQAARSAIEAVFAPGASEKPAELMKHLAGELKMHKNQWPTSLLRRMWDLLMQLEAGRRRSSAHESRWLNLAGFALRPGYGFAVDDWRVAETWRNLRDKLAYAASYSEALVLWRRVAGGLSRGQQLAIAEPALAEIRALHRRFSGGPQRGGRTSINPAELAEIWRLLGSLELLDVSVKVELGRSIAALLSKPKLDNVRASMVWALGRLGQRVPVYGPLNTVVPVEHVIKWVETLFAQTKNKPIAHLAAMQLARRTGDRHRDLPESIRTDILQWLQAGGAAPHLVELVREVGRLDEEQQNQVYGESLPKGLQIR